jgi:hypothetical protein
MADREALAAKLGEGMGEHVTRKAVVLDESSSSRRLGLLDMRKFRAALHRRMCHRSQLAAPDVTYEFRGRTADGWDVWRCRHKASGSWIEGYFPSYSTRLTVHDQGQQTLAQ